MQRVTDAIRNLEAAKAEGHDDAGRPLEIGLGLDVLIDGTDRLRQRLVQAVTTDNSASEFCNLLAAAERVCDPALTQVENIILRGVPKRVPQNSRKHPSRSRDYGANPLKSLVPAEGLEPPTH